MVSTLSILQLHHTNWPLPRAIHIILVLHQPNTLRIQVMKKNEVAWGYNTNNIDIDEIKLFHNSYLKGTSSILQRLVPLTRLYTHSTKYCF